MSKVYKHIISLEEAMKKPYMTKMDLKDFKKIKKGSEVLYMGGRKAVIKNDGYVLTLKGESGKPVEVNLGMFNHGGAIHEINRSQVSGTKSGWLDSLEDRKYELKKDVKGAQIGNFVNVLLPKGTIIYNLPGGVFADHFSLKNKYTSKSSQGPQWFDKPTFKGVSIRQKPEVLKDIEKHGKVLESINESARRDPESIRKEYKEFKKQSISYLQKEWSRMNRVGNPKELDKEGLISDLLRGAHGDKYVDKAFESKITLDSNTLSIVDDLTDKEMMDIRNKLKMKQDKPMLTWISPNNGVHVMITQGGNVRAIFTGEDTKEQKIAMKILKVKKLGVVESNLTEGKVNEASVPTKFDKEVFKVPPHKMTRDWVLKVAKKYGVEPKYAIAWVNQQGRLDLQEAAQPKILKDLEKMDGQIDYLYDADPETQKIWKKAGFDPSDKDTIILYSYVNHWPPTKKLLDKSKIKYKELEDNDTPGESYIVFNVNEKIELVHVYDDGGDLYGTGELVKGKTKIDRGTIYQLVRMDGNNKIWVEEHNIKLVEMSSAQDGGDKTTGKSKHDDHVEEDIETMWKKTYGEDLKKHYPGIAKILKQRPGIDKRELKRIWDETYGEDFEQEYPALWNKLN
jgi:hypothetical protein